MEACLALANEPMAGRDRKERFSLRHRLGCWCHERWRTELVLSRPLARLAGMRWQALCNRRERLLRGSDDESWVCDWADSSWLTVARVFPEVGARLLRHCLEEWPAAFGGEHGPRSGGTVKASVILPVRGGERIPLFSQVLASLVAQDCDSFEIIVAEEGQEGLYARSGIRGARYVHVAPLAVGDGFAKSRAMNAGVQAARGPIVVLHDADTVVPRCYVRSILERMAAGWDALRPLRFLFCLGPEQTRDYMDSGGTALPGRVDAVMQNFPGCSVAIRRDVYWQIGGHDERFAGWGGEDLEFLDRLKTTRLFAGSYAPAIHLWHPPAPKKASGNRNQTLMEELRARPVAERIQALRRLRNSHNSWGP